MKNSFTHNYLKALYAGPWSWNGVERTPDKLLTGVRITPDSKVQERIQGLVEMSRDTIYQISFEGKDYPQPIFMTSMQEWIPYYGPFDDVPTTESFYVGPKDDGKCECGSGSDDISGAHSTWCKRHLS